MRNSLKTLTALSLSLALVTAGGIAQAGSCGSDKAHAHAADHGEHAQAIYTLAKEAGFKTLTAAIEAAGLQETLTDGGPFTVFAPTDEAFAKLPEGAVEKLLANPEQLKQILLYHVVSGNVMAADVVKLESAETVEGTRIAINTKDGVKVNDANVIKTDIGASNGVVHVIDTVLIPQDM